MCLEIINIFGFKFDSLKFENCIEPIIFIVIRDSKDFEFTTNKALELLPKEVLASRFRHIFFGEKVTCRSCWILFSQKYIFCLQIDACAYQRTIWHSCTIKWNCIIYSIIRIYCIPGLKTSSGLNFWIWLLPQGEIINEELSKTSRTTHCSTPWFVCRRLSIKQKLSSVRLVWEDKYKYVHINVYINKKNTSYWRCNTHITMSYDDDEPNSVA